MKIVKEFILREIAGECVLVPTGATSQEFNGMITISDTAKFIWENIEKVDSLEEMIRMVLDTYEIDEETARRDTIAFVGALVENGFIECTREDGTWKNRMSQSSACTGSGIRRLRLRLRYL